MDFITEETTVYEAVTKYPQLKEVLVAISPKFSKLNNPAIFNTVAKVTPFKMAAKIGGIYARELVLQLNEAIGKKAEYLAYIKSQIPKMQEEFLKKQFASSAAPGEKPAWLEAAAAFEVVDGRKFDEPFGHVVATAAKKAKGQGFIMVQKFEPAPLIAYLASQGFEHYTEKLNEQEFKVYFYKK